MLGPQTLDTTRDYRLILAHPDHPTTTLLGQFSGDEVMAGEIWAGEDQPTLASFAAGWAGDVLGNPALIAKPVVGLSITAGSLVGLSPGTYHYRVLIPATFVEVHRGTVEFEASPGTATAPTVYGTYQELLDYCPVVGFVQGEMDTAGFADARGRAFGWINRQFLSRAEAAIQDHRYWHGPIEAVDPIVITAGYDAGPRWGRSIYPDTTTRDQVEDVRAWLAAGKVIVDDGLREIASKAAGWLILSREVGKAPDGDSYRMHAARLRYEAGIALAGYTARLTTTDDAVIDMVLYP